MKKKIFLGLLPLMALALSACGGGSQSQASQEPSSQQQSQQESSQPGVSSEESSQPGVSSEESSQPGVSSEESSEPGVSSEESSQQDSQPILDANYVLFAAGDVAPNLYAWYTEEETPVPNAEWPGVAMEAIGKNAEGQTFYRASVAVRFDSFIISLGNDQTADILTDALQIDFGQEGLLFWFTENYEQGESGKTFVYGYCAFDSSWIVGDDPQGGGGDPEEEFDFYLVGGNTEENHWSIATALRGFVEDESQEGVYKLAEEIQLPAGYGLKVLGADETWYPGGMGNDYAIEADGLYQVYFDPTGAHTEWYESFFNVVPANAE